jgi:hypothetical protein
MQFVLAVSIDTTARVLAAHTQTEKTHRDVTVDQCVCYYSHASLRPRSGPVHAGLSVRVPTLNRRPSECAARC